MTAITYLNPGWEPVRGGQLRLHHRPVVGPSGERADQFKAMDIDPLAGRESAACALPLRTVSSWRRLTRFRACHVTAGLVLFWSDTRCPHEVLPTTGGVRLAIAGAVHLAFPPPLPSLFLSLSLPFGSVFQSDSIHRENASKIVDSAIAEVDERVALTIWYNDGHELERDRAARLPGACLRYVTRGNCSHISGTQSVHVYAANGVSIEGLASGAPGGPPPTVVAPAPAVVVAGGGEPDGGLEALGSGAMTPVADAGNGEHEVVREPALAGDEVPAHTTRVVVPAGAGGRFVEVL